MEHQTISGSVLNILAEILGASWELFLSRNHTPPYISAVPEVVHRRLPPVPKPGVAASPRPFLILATDGLRELYDGLEREEAAQQWGVRYQYPKERTSGERASWGVLWRESEANVGQKQRARAPHAVANTGAYNISLLSGLPPCPKLSARFVLSCYAPLSREIDIMISRPR